MLIKNYVYAVIIILFVFLFLFFFWTIKNKNKYIGKWINIVSISYILYLLGIIPFSLYMGFPINFGMIIFYLLIVISLLGYSLIIFINIKRKNIYKKLNKKFLIIPIVLIIVPILIILISTFRNIYTINNSDIVIVYELNGEGTVESVGYVGYAIKDQKCIEFDLGIVDGGKRINKFVSKSAIKIKNPSEFGYTIYFNQDLSLSKTMIYKNNKKICEIENNEYYDSNSFKVGYYLKKD